MIERNSLGWMTKYNMPERLGMVGRVKESLVERWARAPFGSYTNVARRKTMV